jgi:hypothetical protein
MSLLEGPRILSAGRRRLTEETGRQERPSGAIALALAAAPEDRCGRSAIGCDTRRHRRELALETLWIA